MIDAAVRERAAYGPIASRWAQLVSPDQPLIAVDAQGAAEGLIDAFRRARQGRRFRVRCLVEERRAALARVLTPTLLQQAASYDERRIVFSNLASESLQVNNAPLSSVRHLPANIVQTMQDIVRLSDGLVISSQSEYHNLLTLWPGYEPQTGYMQVSDSTVPAPPADIRLRGETIVVWAPHLSAQETGIFAIALEELEAPVRIVCSSGEIPGMHATFVGLEGGAAALKGASVVVDANVFGPETAIALAAWRLPMVTAYASGAHEVLEFARTCDPADHCAILRAVYAAMALPHARTRSSAAHTAVSMPAYPPNDGPLVTTIVLTHNRRDLLPIALESVAAQTYKNMQTIVVNDAGERVDDIAARFEHTQLVHLDSNLGSAGALNAGFAHARGEYFSILADDDLYFPDHIARLVDALERSGKDVAHADTISCFVHHRSGTYTTYGLQAMMTRAMDRTEILVDNRIPVMAALVRRSIVGSQVLDPALPMARDYELWLRLGLTRDFAHVERVTSAYMMCDDESQMTARLKNRNLEAHQLIYRKYPTPNRPIVETRRRALLEAIEKYQFANPTQPPITLPESSMAVIIDWNEQRYFEETAALKSLAVQDDVLVLGTDFSNVSRTLSHLVQARRLGKVIALYPLLADPMENVFEQVGTAIAQQSGDAARFMQLVAMRENRLNVNQKPLAQAAQISPESLRAAILCVKLCDVLLCFTAGEKDRWSGLIGSPIRRFAYLPVPHVYSRRSGGGVAVYAPGSGESQLALIALALQERRVRAEIVREHRPDFAAATLVVPDWWRPARVLALARAGYQVVAPEHGRPDERCSCAVYAPADAFSFGAALDAAQSSTVALRFDLDAAATVESIRAAAPLRSEGPRVSIVVRTFDRPVLLGRALRSIVAQTYVNVEIIVVNNGGPDVEDLVRVACANRPYRYVALPQRSHISVASNAGARAAGGVYIGYLDDDDLFYPDHVAHAVDALESSGADLAYTNCLAEYAQIEGGRKRILGFQIFRDSEFVAKELYMDNFAPIHSIMHRREIFERFGYFDESLPVTDDWEMWLRASRGSRFVHVSHVTCEYSWRFDPDRGNMTLTHQRQFAESYETITNRYRADVAEIPSITQQQAQVKSVQQQRAAQLVQLGPRIAELTIASMAQSAVAADPQPIDPFA